MQPSIRVTLLGGFAVTVNGVDCDVPEAASRLIALLALRPQETFRVEIAAQLWPDRGLVSAFLHARHDRRADPHRRRSAYGRQLTVMEPVQQARLGSIIPGCWRGAQQVSYINPRVFPYENDCGY